MGHGVFAVMRERYLMVGFRSLGCGSCRTPRNTTTSGGKMPRRYRAPSFERGTNTYRCNCTKFWLEDIAGMKAVRLSSPRIIAVSSHEFRRGQ